MPKLSQALLGPWETKFNKKGWKASYVISKDKNNKPTIRVKTCQWKGCNKTRSAILEASTDTRYPSSAGWFRAKSLHKPEVDLYVKKDGEKNQVVYENRVTKEKVNGNATQGPDLGNAGMTLHNFFKFLLFKFLLSSNNLNKIKTIHSNVF